MKLENDLVPVLFELFLCFKIFELWAEQTGPESTGLHLPIHSWWLGVRLTKRGIWSEVMLQSAAASASVCSEVKTWQITATGRDVRQSSSHLFTLVSVDFKVFNYSPVNGDSRHTRRTNRPDREMGMRTVMSHRGTRPRLTAAAVLPWDVWSQSSPLNGSVQMFSRHWGLLQWFCFVF